MAEREEGYQAAALSSLEASSDPCPPSAAEGAVGRVVFFNALAALLGVSAFALPWGFLVSGTLGGLLVVALVALASLETSRILLLAQYRGFLSSGRIQSYPELAQTHLGAPLGALVKGATVLSCLGGCIACLIFMGSLLSQLLRVDAAHALLLLLPPLLGLALVRSFRDLAWLSVLAFLATLLALSTLLLDGYHQQLTRAAPAAASSALFLAGAADFVGPMTFLFTLHYILLSMSKEILADSLAAGRDLEDAPLSDGARGHVPRVVRPLALAYACSALLLSLLGWLGVRYYRGASLVRDEGGAVLPGCERRVCENVLLNLSAGPLRSAVGCCLVLSVSLCYAIGMAPAREHVEAALLGAAPTVLAENLVRAGLVLATVCVALRWPRLGAVLAAVGGLTDALQALVLPPLIHMRASGAELGAGGRCAYAAIALAGGALMLRTLLVLALR